MPLMTRQTRPRLRARRSQLVTNGFYLVSGPRKLQTVAALLVISRFAAHRTGASARDASFGVLAE